MQMNNYALEWYNYGLQRGDDAIVKFMMHWIAFNWLYGEYKYGREMNETQAIREFCRYHYKKLSRYNAFKTKEINIFMEGPVMSIASGMMTDEGTRDYKKVVRGEGLERITALLLTIYRVRCNLFHGSKSLMIQRDRDLVHAASVLLEGYLKAVLAEE